MPYQNFTIKCGDIMSELSRAISRARLCNIFKANRNTELKEAFKLGWEAREELLNKRVAEIERAATLKERERCFAHSEFYEQNSITARNISAAIQGGK